jgi:hypothetical protein
MKTSLWQFFANNWAQISFILLALGYVIKVILEARFKRKEIRYNFFLNNRMKSIETFLSNYANLESTFKDSFTSYIFNTLTSKEIDNIVVPLRYKLNDSLSLLQLYLNDNEFTQFKYVYTNLIIVIGEGFLIKRNPLLNETNREFEFAGIFMKMKSINQNILSTEIRNIQKRLL